MKKIVIVGGGVAGKTVAAELIKNKTDIDITLITPKEYFEVPYGAIRALVEPSDFSPKIRKKFSELLPGINIIQDTVNGIEKDSIKTEGGQTISFDYLVLATGANHPNWSFLTGKEINSEDRQKTVEAEGKKLAEAQKILIIGGGPVGVELAGEIAGKWSDKDITLAESSNRLLSTMSHKMSRRADSVLTKMGVKIVKNTRINPEDRLATQADIVYTAVGISVNSNWIGPESGIPKNEKGAVKVEKDLRVEGRKNIFALGDLNNVEEIKLGAFASIQAKLTAKSLTTLIEDPDAVIKAYKPGKSMGFVTIGPKFGAVQLPFGHPHFMIGIKQKDLFSSSYLKTAI